MSRAITEENKQLQKQILVSPLGRAIPIGTYDRKQAHQQAQTARRIANRLGIELRTDYDARNGSLMATKLQGLVLREDLYSYNMVLHIQAETRKKQRKAIEEFNKQKETLYEQKITPTAQLSEAQQLAKRVLDGETVRIMPDYSKPHIWDGFIQALKNSGLSTKLETLTIHTDQSTGEVLFQRIKPEHN